MRSIFEDVSPHLGGKFWTKIETPVSSFSSVEIYRDVLLETSEAKNFMKKRNYLLTNSSLFVVGEDYQLTVKESLIKWMVLEPFIETLGEDTKYGFRLKQGSCYKDFYTDTNENLDNWIDKLSNVCLLSSIENDYKFMKKIGKGSFADVYLAKDLTTSENVAIKTIHKVVCLQSPNGLSALINEIEIMRKLDHPNIVKLYKIYESEHHVSLILDYLEGGELFSRVLAKSSYTEKEAARLIWKLLKVLEYMSSKNIIHRDIKLENILLKTKDSCTDFKLIDFGLASECLENLTLRCGSPGYIAPEILKKNPYNTKADVFSAGIILYLLLSGRSPFPGKNNAEVLARNRDCRLHFEDTYWGNISAQATKFVISLTESNPDLRPTAREALKSSWFSILHRHKRHHSHNQPNFSIFCKVLVQENSKEDECDWMIPTEREGIASVDASPSVKSNHHIFTNFQLP